MGLIVSFLIGPSGDPIYSIPKSFNALADKSADKVNFQTSIALSLVLDFAVNLGCRA